MGLFCRAGFTATRFPGGARSAWAGGEPAKTPRMNQKLFIEFTELNLPVPRMTKSICPRLCSAEIRNPIRRACQPCLQAAMRRFFVAGLAGVCDGQLVQDARSPLHVSVSPDFRRRVYSLCGIRMVLPPMNSRMTASPGMNRVSATCAGVKPSTDSSSVRTRS